MKRIYLIYIALLLCPAMLSSCTSGFLAKAASVGVDIMTEVFTSTKKDAAVPPEPKAVYIDIKFPSGIIIEEKPGFWSRLFGKKLADNEFRTSVYIVGVSYSDEYIYYHVQTLPSRVNENNIVHGSVSWKIRKDSYKGKDIDETFMISDPDGEPFKIQRIETDNVRKTIITKLPITVQVK